MWSPLKPFLLGLGLVLAATAGRAQVRTGAVFPTLAPAAFEGVLPPTADRVVLVDFWASWCAPCRASFPAYARLQAAYGSRGLVILAISVDQSPVDFAAFVRRQHPPFATVRDRGQALVAAVDVPVMPTSYLLGRDGTVRFIHAGFHGEATERDLRREIDGLLGEAPPRS
jgi:thiol-disulfide isomerase/thioredoxin